MNWRERRDMPYIVGAVVAVLVVILICVFTWN